ncbi:MAG: hypothetical protein ACTSXP_10235 [Promethearchaeota archaeon]
MILIGRIKLLYYSRIVLRAQGINVAGSMENPGFARYLLLALAVVITWALDGIYISGPHLKHGGARLSKMENICDVMAAILWVQLDTTIINTLFFISSKMKMPRGFIII